MNAQYLAIWKLLGASTLATGTDKLELARLDNPTLVATVTADPEPFFLHIDQSAVIANQLMRGITGMFAPDQSGTFEERIAVAIENLNNRWKEGRRLGNAVLISG